MTIEHDAALNIGESLDEKRIEAKREYNEIFCGEGAAEADRAWRIGMNDCAHNQLGTAEAELYIRVEGLLSIISEG